MRFSGTLGRDGKYWLADVAMFDARTQGRTREEALEMIEDWFVTMIDRKEFSARVHLTGRASFEVSCDDSRSIISFLLRRQRQMSGLSLQEAAERLGMKSKNAYARYEQGTSVPTVEKLEELLHAVAPGREIVLLQSRAA